MPRYAAEFGYEGAKFYGWQTQAGFVTVQESIEQALTKINKNRYVPVAGAGRTDSGVHAKGQVCSFDMDKDWDPFRLRLALNANLPQGVYSVKLVKTDKDFHARFSAVSREYVYFIWQDTSIYPHLEPVCCWIKSRGRDWSRASEACRYLVGVHNFRNFCRKDNIPENPVRELFRVSMRQRGSLIRLHISGSGFLTNMVRIILGDLELIAKGQREPEWINRLFDPNHDREDSGRTFPPEGLFLWKINYAKELWK